ncbi:uncharacterized protein TNCV_3156071 [Trichonephila clavipes]|nr:uncharacterized protein TNCV_3156071 [Trichonephila clavipes]
MDNYPLIWIFRQLRIVNSQPAKNLVIPSQVSRPFTRLYKAKEDLVLPGTFGSLSDERRSHVEKKGRPDKSKESLKEFVFPKNSRPDSSIKNPDPVETSNFSDLKQDVEQIPVNTDPSEET